MKAPIEHNRCIAVELKIDNKNFSTLSKIFSALRTLGQEGNEDYRINLKISPSINSARTLRIAFYEFL